MWLLAEHTIQDVAVPGIFAILVLKMVFDFMGKHKTKNGDADVAKQVKDLHKWHAPDSDGEQSWKNKQLCVMCENVKTAVDNNTAILNRLVPILDRMEVNRQ